MDHLKTRDFYLARAEFSRGLAKRADNPIIAEIYIEMAREYENAIAKLNELALRKSGAMQPGVSDDAGNSHRIPQSERALPGLELLGFVAAMPSLPEGAAPSAHD